MKKMSIHQKTGNSKLAITSKRFVPKKKMSAEPGYAQDSASDGTKDLKELTN